MAKRSRRYNGAMSGNMMTKALGKMVGLLLSLYVFDEVISAIAPSLWNCATGYTLNESTVSLSSATCYNASNLSQATVSGSQSAYFGTAMTFVGNLFPVIGILGAFEIIYTALRQAKLV